MIELESGILKLHSSTVSVNPSADAKSAHEIVAAQNTAAYLRESFFTETPNHIAHTELPSGGKVAVLFPTGPYADISILVIAAGPESLSRDLDQTEFIYDYPEDVQLEYWRSTLTILNQLKQSSDPAKEIVLAVENSVAQRTNQAQRTSRSISLPHTQVLLLQPDQVEKTDWRFTHLEREQRVLRFSAITKLIQQKLSEVTDQKLSSVLHSVVQQQKAPYGYSFSLPLTFNAADVSHIMKLHHQAYTAAANEALSTLKDEHQSEIIAQPSYRVYISRESDFLQVIISPEFLSHAGVMEAAGILLDRSSAHPQRVSPEKFAALRQEIVTALLKAKN